MSMITTNDGVQIVYKDWAAANPLCFLTAGHCRETTAKRYSISIPTSGNLASDRLLIVRRSLLIVRAQ